MTSFHEDVIERFLAGTDTEAVELHLSSCPPCRRALAAGLGDEPEIRPIPRELLEKAKRIGVRSARGNRRRAWLTAAALFAAIAIGVVIRSRLVDPVREPADVLRRGSAPNATIQLTSPRDGGRVNRSRVELRWTPVPDGRRYTVRILDTHGAILLERTSDTTSIEITDLSVERGARCYWYVIATTGDGHTIESPLRSMQVDTR